MDIAEVAVKCDEEFRPRLVFILTIIITILKGGWMLSFFVFMFAFLSRPNCLYRMATHIHSEASGSIVLRLGVATRALPVRRY